jgi:hypothetical protein
MASYILIATTTVGSGGAASIDFTGIPQTYTDLLLVGSCRTSSAVHYETNRMKINGSSSNMTSVNLYGAGGGVGTVGAITSYLFIGYIGGSAATANTFNTQYTYIPNYTSSSYKSVSSDSHMENNHAVNYAMGFSSGLWSQTAAITSLGIYPESGSWVEFSSASLYGIKNS